MGKYLSVFLLSLVSSQVFAYACPEGSQKDGDFRKGIAFLKSVEGTYKLGTCNLEIKACDSTLPERSSNLIGEVFVKDVYNREQYAPLYFQDREMRESTATWEPYRNSAFYVFHDKVYDGLNGQSESIYVDIYKDEKTGSLKKLSLGIYGTKRRVRRYLFFHTSQWSSCTNEVTKK
jgi:hypothetical protein